MKRLGEQVSVSFWYLADARQCAAHVRSWHKADISTATAMSHFGGKADMRFYGFDAGFSPSEVVRR